jgi:predicted N-formylglutamate amidohydrolase
VKLLITCEHGGNRVPAECRLLFRHDRQLLESHRAYDAGSLPLARMLARHLRAPLYYSTVTRLVVELNRSVGHPQLYSPFTRSLPRSDRENLLRRYYLPYRSQIEHWIAKSVLSGETVWHLSVHTFTPKMNGIPRRADIGLLYDPARSRERRWADRWRGQLQSCSAQWKIRRNYPYLGKADGLTTALRRRFSPTGYLGLELEVNQRWWEGDRRAWRQLTTDLVESLSRTVGADGASSRR